MLNQELQITVKKTQTILSSIKKEKAVRLILVEATTQMVGKYTNLKVSS